MSRKIVLLYCLACFLVGAIIVAGSSYVLTKDLIEVNSKQHYYRGMTDACTKILVNNGYKLGAASVECTMNVSVAYEYKWYEEIGPYWADAWQIIKSEKTLKDITPVPTVSASP